MNQEILDWPKLTLDDYKYFQNIMLKYNMRRAYIRYNESIKSYQVFNSKVEDSALIFIDDINDVINKKQKQ